MPRYRNSSGERIRLDSGARMNDSECCCGTTLTNCTEFNAWLSANGYLGTGKANATLTSPGDTLDCPNGVGSFSLPKVALGSGALWQEDLDLVCTGTTYYSTFRQIFVSCLAPTYVRVQGNQATSGTHGYLGEKDFYFPFDPADIFGQSHSLVNGQDHWGSGSVYVP